MNIVQFNSYKDFFLQRNCWGVENPRNIIKVLDNVISNFYYYLDETNIVNKKVIVTNINTNSIKKSPEFIPLNDYNLIYLTAKINNWQCYVYEFSHELCHHVISSNFFYNNDRFGWLEESFCELTSLFILIKMSIEWKENPPYKSKDWRKYSKVLESSALKLIEDTNNKINQPFDIWLHKNLTILYKNRANRQMNRIVAAKLLPIINQIPELLQILQFMKHIEVNSNTYLTDFLEKWKKMLPEKLKYEFLKIENILIGNKNIN